MKLYSFPIVLKIFIKILYQNLNEVLKAKANKIEQIFNILGEILFNNWLSKPLFLKPSLYGLISNNEISNLKSVLNEFSKLVGIIMNGGKIHGIQKWTWIYYFKDFIDEKLIARNKLINDLIAYEIPSNFCFIIFRYWYHRW